jgi:hypothetical protein
MNYVNGPDGQIITINDLPDPKGRWTAKRKAVVIAAVRGGLLTLSDATARYKFSASELARLGELLNGHSQEGLRTTYVKQYR